jgi:diguanylate cyclase (GGDEF)-like protein
MSPISLILICLGFVLLSATLGLLIHMARSQGASQKTVAERTATVDRLLDFSQTIQGAGKADQIFATLAHFLRHELSLSGVAILTADPELVPSIQLRAAYPKDLVAEANLAELDSALCPCLRQNLPRTFRPDGSPVRCSIDTCLKLPDTHPAHCVPINIGRKMQAVIHMLLPPGSEWSEDKRQLAQTYVNCAHSALTSLHLLAEAEKQSMTDVLTGLYNRRSMESLLQREVALCERHALPLSIVMIDLDFFKQINDTHGHAAGDHMLKSFADCVRITLRKTDLAFRYGGDEFVIALPQTPLFQAQQVVQKLRQAFLSVDFSHAITNLEKPPTLSIGVAERSKATNILTLASLLSAADQALYAAKNSTRNCIRVFEPVQAA